MTTTEDELARPLTAEEEAKLRRFVRWPGPNWADSHSEVLLGYLRQLLATLDALRATPVADTAGIDAALTERIGAVIDRWYHLGLLRFNSRDDGSDDLILRDELVAAALRTPKPGGERWPRPQDFDRMTAGEFHAYVERIGFDARIKAALADVALERLATKAKRWHDSGTMNDSEYGAVCAVLYVGDAEAVTESDREWARQQVAALRTPKPEGEPT